VTALATEHHWSVPDARCREVRRVLAPAGRFVAIERRIADSAWVVGLAKAGVRDAARR